MKIIKNLYSRTPYFTLLFLISTFLLGCRVGEDDPLISFRSRDARIKSTWRLLRLDSETRLNQFNQGSSPIEINVSVTYDGQDIRAVVTNNESVVTDTTIGFAYIMELLDRGKLTYTTTTITQGVGVRSGGDDSWFWLNDDRRKSRIYLGNALQFNQLLGPLAVSQPFFSDFEVVELRKDLLRLSLRKRVEQTGLDGNFQEFFISGQFEFGPN